MKVRLEDRIDNMKKKIKKLEEPEKLKAKERKYTNDSLKMTIKGYKEQLERWQKDFFEKDKEDEKKEEGKPPKKDDKKDGEEEKEEIIQYDTKKEKQNIIDLKEYKKKQEEFYKKNIENIDLVDQTKLMLENNQFEKDYQEYKKYTIQCIVEND